MEKIRINRGGHFVTGFRGHRENTMVKPEVKRTYHQGKGTSRVRLYETTDGRVFLADVYDRIFTVQADRRIRSRHFKGKSIDSRAVA